MVRVASVTTERVRVGCNDEGEKHRLGRSYWLTSAMAVELLLVSVFMLEGVSVASTEFWRGPRAS
jgi:hypothetical protein